MNNINEAKFLQFINSIIPFDVPDWLAFMIMGFLLVFVIYTIVKLGDILFKVIIIAVILVVIFLLFNGNIISCIEPSIISDINTTALSIKWLL